MLCLLFLIFIQVVFEAFPVSSSGHLLLFLSLFFAQNSTAHTTMLTLLNTPELILWMQLPAIGIVALFFRSVWWPLLRHVWRTWPLIVKLVGHMLCSNIITFLFYLVLTYHAVMMPLWIGFGITGILLISLVFCPRRARNPLTVKRALMLGIVQGIALLPGISRFASVFVISRWMGIGARRSFLITWMLHWPLAVGMSLISGYQYIQHPTSWVPLGLTTMGLVGVASALSLFGLFLMYQLAQRNMLWLMSFYMIIPFAISFLYGF